MYINPKNYKNLNYIEQSEDNSYVVRNVPDNFVKVTGNYGTYYVNVDKVSLVNIRANHSYNEYRTYIQFDDDEKNILEVDWKITKQGAEDYELRLARKLFKLEIP